VHAEAGVHYTTSVHGIYCAVSTSLGPITTRKSYIHTRRIVERTTLKGRVDRRRPVMPDRTSKGRYGIAPPRKTTMEKRQGGLGRLRGSKERTELGNRMRGAPAPSHDSSSLSRSCDSPLCPLPVRSRRNTGNSVCSMSSANSSSSLKRTFL